MDSDGRDDLLVTSDFLLDTSGSPPNDYLFLADTLLGGDTTLAHSDADIIYDSEYLTIVGRGGDLFGDGGDDLVLADITAPHEGLDSAGECRVLPGPVAPGSYSFGSAGELVAGGTEENGKLWCQPTPGDLDQDGRDDLLIWAPTGYSVFEWTFLVGGL